jgi:hypothetical protein
LGNLERPRWRGRLPCETGLTGFSHGNMPDEVKRYVARSPFQPFVINTADGLARPVPSLDHTFVGKYIAVLDSEGLIEIISPQHISSVALQAAHYEP